MKTTSILIMALAMMTTADSMAIANEIKVDFDSPGACGSLPELVTKINEAEHIENATIPTPAAVTWGIIDGSDTYQDKLVLAKDLLADITPEMRVDFVSSVHFDGNGINSEGRSILSYAGLTEPRISRIASAFHASPDVKEPYTFPARSLDMLLKDLPADVKRDFTDNLKFLNGNIVSAKTDLLESAVSPENYEKILDIIMPTSTAKSGTGAVTRAKDEVCIAYTGAKSRGVLRGCDWVKGYTCNPATCVSSKN